MRNPKLQDEDDMFSDTRMSFGDHIEELRTHLWRAIWGLLFCMFVGFFLDQFGDWIDRPNIGIGKPAMEIIKAPVTKALNEFYDARLQKLEKATALTTTDPDMIKLIELVQEHDDEQLAEELKRPENAGARKLNEYLKDHSDDPRNAKLPRGIHFTLSRQEVAKMRNQPVEQVSEPLVIRATVPPLDMGKANVVQRIVRPPELSSLTATETFIVYFKVSLVCGLIIASPWVFWQIWSFIAKGLHRHEKKYVHIYLPFSLGLFITGVVVCQFLVMPRSVAALLWFNEFLGITPELRLNDWLSFAVMLPLLFGVSFQTPLVMLFLERIGIMGVQSFKSKRKYAIFIMAIFAGVITPTPDALTMCCMWLPMCALYELGIWMCYFMPGRHKEEPDVDVPTSDELIEV